MQVYHCVRESCTNDGGAAKAIDPESWVEFLNTAELIDGVFGEEEAAFCFIMSMPIVVDEMQTDRHKEMALSDFIEALGESCGGV